MSHLAWTVPVAPDDHREIPLETKLIGFTRCDCHGIYECYLEHDKDNGKLTFCVTAAKELHTCGIWRWYLSSLVKRSYDRIDLDSGQDWYVTGMLEAVAEAIEHI